MYIPDYDLEGEEQEGLNVRVPPKMKEEIVKRYSASGISMARWTRKALLFALQHMENDEEIILPKDEMKALIREALIEEGVIKK